MCKTREKISSLFFAFLLNSFRTVLCVLEGNKTTSGKMRKSMKSIESDSKHRITSDDVIDILQLVTMVSKTIADWMKMTEKHDKEVRYF